MRSIKTYRKNIDNLKAGIKEINLGIDRIAILRGIIFILAAISIYNEVFRNRLLFGAAGIILVLAFTFLAYIHTKEKDKLKELELLISINQEHIKRAQGEWKEFKDTGEEFLNSDHPFINDLDIFGEGSVFQWINTTKTFFGREKLGQILSFTRVPDEVAKRQKALKELGDKIDFRQKLQAIPQFSKNKVNIADNFISWTKEENPWFLSSQAKFIRIIMTSISVITLLALIILRIPFSVFLLALTVNGGILILKKKDVEKALSEIYSFKNSMNIYGRLIKTIENESFKEEFNINIQNALIKDVKASDEIGELKMIGEMLFDRMNAFYWIFNALLMWDFALLARLEKWKIKNRDRIGVWLYALGEMEACCALSNIHFDKSEWVLPEITEAEEIDAKEFTHPLIVPEGVKNSFFLGGEIKTSLITGSNMSGKSTFLRTTGLNMVFSYLGLPVNAEVFKTGRMVPYTCMRTKDNLEEGISSFYAEILRVKNIIRATEKGEKVFFLLDEIFKGTNSADRHTGAEMLIKQLMDRGSRGLVSTHDLELCELEKTDSRINNLHFKEDYTDNEIKFDYKLRKGKSTTRNAVYLMKMAGINLE